jgi:RimJ/RimL family protein N-acetyltransferase
MLYSLSAESIRKRYFTHTRTFPHRDVQKLANIDYRQDIAIVRLVPSVSGEEIVAIAQYFLDPKTRVAELAFIVQDEWQKRGMATFLLDYLTEIARKRGVRTFTASVLPANKPMLAIFANSGYKVSTAFDGEAYQIHYDVAKHGD